MTTKILAYKNGSESAKSLRDALGVKMLKKVGSKWTGKAGDIVINWGSSAPFAGIGQATYLNSPQAVARAANKLQTQMAFNNSEEAKPYMLSYVTSKEAAAKLIREGFVIVCRTKLTGNSGEGIVIANNVGELVDAPLYTVYKKKQQEYRVHVFDGKVISIQRKARKIEVEDDKVNWQVRNLDGGFIFARTGFDVPRSVTRAAKIAVKTLGLDFGAADIGHHNKEGTFVYEVNTACGLSGSNLTDYVEAFCEKLDLPNPVRPEDYVPPTVPNDGEDGVGLVAANPAPALQRRILTNREVEDIVRKHGEDRATAVKEIVALTDVPLHVAEGMYGRAKRVFKEDEIKKEDLPFTRQHTLGEKNVRYLAGNFKRVLTPEQQLKLAKFIAEL